MKDLYLKQLQREVYYLLKIYTEQDAYLEFIKYLDNNIEIKNQFNDLEIDAIFPRPQSIV